MEKNVVTVSRNWHNPRITTTVSREGIEIGMGLNDFVTAVKREIGSVAMVFTQAEFDKRFEAAVDRVVAGMKAETAKVM